MRGVEENRAKKNALIPHERTSKANSAIAIKAISCFLHDKQQR